jgi:hypothetical protein
MGRGIAGQLRRFGRRAPDDPPIARTGLPVASKLLFCYVNLS